MNFQRGISVKEALDLGGFSFETLRVGAILKAKKYFKTSFISKKYTNIPSFKIHKEDYFIITNIKNIMIKKIYIWICFLIMKVLN